MELTEILQQDLNDLKGLFKYEEYGLSKSEAKLQAKGIFANLSEHIEELLTLS